MGMDITFPVSLVFPIGKLHTSPFTFMMKEAIRAMGSLRGLLRVIRLKNAPSQTL